MGKRRRKGERERERMLVYKSVLSIPSEDMFAKVDSLRKSNREADKERRTVSHHYPLYKFSQNQCAKIYYPYVKICPGDSLV